jgi:neopullulanase
MKRASRMLWRLIFLPMCFAAVILPARAQSPEVLKVEPPGWWVGSSMNPIRLLIRGRNLGNTQVQTLGSGIRVDGVPKVNERGTAMFINVTIATNARPGEHRLRISNAGGVSEARFEILPGLNRTARFQGFSPADVMYLIMIDRFADGDPSNNDPAQSRGLYNRKNKYYYHGGDLQGVIDHLPYLKDLGVTALWLTPWYDNYDRLNEIELKEGKPCTGFHGYNPQDFYAVEEHFGSLAKLQELAAAAHKLGIKIIQDEVVNHTGPYHPWIDDPPTPTWFNGTKQRHLANVFQTWVLHDPHPVNGLKQATMEGWFLNFLPDLNQNDPEVARYLVQNSLWWIGVTGTDGIRMDTWQYVPNTFWHQWTRALKREFPKLTVVGEVKDGDVVHTSYFQGGKDRDGVDSGLDSLLDFPLFYAIRHAFAEDKNLDEVPKTLAKDYLYANPNILVTLLGGHDDGRFMSEKDATIAGLKLANAFVLTTRGVPQLYYGDEIAMTGADEPTTRADFPGGFPGDPKNAFTRAGRSKEEQELFDYVRQLARLRNELEPLKHGALINLYVSGQQYAYARKISARPGQVKVNDDYAVIAINNDAKSATIAFDVGPTGLREGADLRDQLDNQRVVKVANRQLRITLPARTAAVFANR